MPIKLINALSTRKVQTASPGMHCDGGGLYLRVKPNEAGDGINRSWLYRYRMPKPDGKPAGKLRDHGLGALPDITLSKARELAARCRQQRRDGLDPIETKKARSVPAVLMTFDEAAARFIESREDTWRNAKHGEQWRRTLNDFASPVIGKVPVRDVDTTLVTRVLEPIWRSVPETANRVRARVEMILDWCKASGLREGENPARLRGHLDHILPPLAAVRRAKREQQQSDGHHKALPYTEVGAFMAELRSRTGAAARALEFAILTAGRTGEVIGAKFGEIDLDAAVWTIPASRMKGNREHRVPLSAQAIEIIKAQAAIREGDHVFNGDRVGEPLSNMAMLELLKRMGRTDVTVHGFRSTFRDWAGDCTSFARDVVEAALAHALKDKTEAAYRRADAFEKRRRLMDAWASYCDKPSLAAGKVVPMRKAEGS
jgi:integrase